MRKIAILVGAVALLTMLVAGAALAVNFQCTTNPCFGTNNADVIAERGGSLNDEIFARAGADRVNADLFGSDTDVLWGQGGDDRLDARDGDPRDTLNGGRGFDRCWGGPNDDFAQNCEVINGEVQ